MRALFDIPWSSEYALTKRQNFWRAARALLYFDLFFAHILKKRKTFGRTPDLHGGLRNYFDGKKNLLARSARLIVSCVDIGPGFVEKVKFQV